LTQGLSVPYDETLSRLRSTLEGAGIEFQFNGAVGIGIAGVEEKNS
jgi:hypothetical protein